MAMEALPTMRKKPTGKGAKRGEKRERKDNSPFAGNSRYTPKLLGKAYFQRKKGCPFSGPKAPKIDYKDVRQLSRYVSDYGKIMPRHLSGVCAIKQRELAQAIKRARHLGLMGYINRPEREDRPSMADRAPRTGGERSFAPRGERTERTTSGGRHAPRSTEE